MLRYITLLLPNCNPEIEYVLAYFIKERMDIFWGRLAGEEPPYTKDPIMQRYKFTNVYRVTDRASQWMIRNVIYNHDWNAEDYIFRVLLYKHFNLPSTWTGLIDALGFEPTVRNFNTDLYIQALKSVAASYPAVYSGAYMVAGVKGYKVKYEGYMHIFRELLNPQSGFLDRAIACKSMEELHWLIGLQSYVGSFLAYQYTTDLNYTPIWKFSENDLAVATVGSKRGIEKLLGGLKPRSYAEVIRFYVNYQNELLITHGLDKEFVNLFGRRLQPIDIQNCFCEIDKYTRIFKPGNKTAGGYQPSRMKNTFKKSSWPYKLMFPTWWDIAEFNDRYTVQ